MSKSGGKKYQRTALEKINGPTPQLKPVDIVLVHNKHSLFRFFLRQVTESYWDHSALVMYPRSNKNEMLYSVIVESIRPGLAGLVGSRGVALHRLDKYFNDPKKYDVGIVRVEGLSNEERAQVRLFMLANVDAPYWPWHYIEVMLAAMLPPLRPWILRRQRFSCSSLIQKAFFDALGDKYKSRVVFKTGVWSPIELDELTSPGDIAKSKNVTWIYNKH